MFPYNSNDAQREKEIKIEGRWAWPIRGGEKRIMRLALFLDFIFSSYLYIIIFMKIIVAYIIAKSFPNRP
jgi:hypothetical protein